MRPQHLELLTWRTSPFAVGAIAPLLATIAVFTGAPTTSAAGIVVATPLRDNTLFQSVSGIVSNGVGPALFAGVNGTGIARRAVLFFDVAAVIPAGSTVDSAMLELNVAQVSDPEPRVMTLHRVSADWGEGSSSTSGGAGAPATPGDATWLHTFFPNSLWDAPGGDFATTATASAVVGGIGPCAWTGAGVASDVQAWLDQPASNHGWLLHGDESVTGTSRRFDSRESPETVRPRLTIYYSTGTTDVIRTRWGRIKARYR